MLIAKFLVYINNKLKNNPRENKQIRYVDTNSKLTPSNELTQFMIIICKRKKKRKKETIMSQKPISGCVGIRTMPIQFENKSQFKVGDHSAKSGKN